MYVWSDLGYLDEPVEQVGAVLDIHVHVREELAQPDEDLVKVRQDVPSRHLSAGRQHEAQCNEPNNTEGVTPSCRIPTQRNEAEADPRYEYRSSLLLQYDHYGRMKNLPQGMQTASLDGEVCTMHDRVHCRPEANSFGSGDGDRRQRATRGHHQ